MLHINQCVFAAVKKKITFHLNFPLFLRDTFRNANTTPTVVPGVDLLGMNVGGFSFHFSLKIFPVN